MPPTVNTMYVPLPNGGRAISKAYRNWKEIAGKEVLPYKVGFRRYDNPPFAYDAWFYFGNDLVQDADNRLKALQDMLADVLGFNDTEILDGSFHKRTDKKNPRCEVFIWGNLETAEHSAELASQSRKGEGGWKNSKSAPKSYKKKR
jgi:hypothetical protein